MLDSLNASRWLVRNGTSREYILSHLLNSSFATTPLILLFGVAAREDVLSR